MNPNGKVQLVFANVLGNLHVPLISKNPNDILAWNKEVNEYIVGVFDLQICFWPLMGLSCYFTHMTSKF